MISIVVAHDRNLAIGKDNDLPWQISEDLKRFKEVTLGHPVIMGRKTFESIYNRLKKPLPGRQNIVISSQLNNMEDVTIARNLQKAIDAADVSNEIFIIGGARVFEEAIKKQLADRMYVTYVDTEVEGDTFFLPYDETNWKLVEKMNSSNEKYNYSFLIYDRVKK